MQKVHLNLILLVSSKVNSLGVSIVDLSYSSIRAAEAKDYLPAHRFTQPGITLIGSGATSSYTGEPETAVEQRAAKIILENIQL